MVGADRAKSLDAVMAQIEKAHGKGAVMRLGDEVRVPIDVIPTGSIALDVALGIGGLPRGRVVEIYGPESSGKTTVALHAVANAQKAGGIAAFIDAEHALDPDYAQKLGVDTDALLVSQPDTGEQALEIADMLIRSGAIDIIVIDSVAALVPRAEIEGEMGDSHVGLQARLMSQALRKLTGTISSTNTTMIFINQLREKIGIMFGCVTYNTQITLADGLTRKIGQLVDERAEVEVLSFDEALGAVTAKRITNWFDNGPTQDFIELVVRTGVTGTGHPGTSTLELTSNHLVRTPGGWREAGELKAGDRVMTPQQVRLSDQQWQVILGGLMGDGSLSESAAKDGCSARFRMGHGAEQVEYIDWKVSLLGNIGQRRSVSPKGSVHVDLTPLAELSELRDVVYRGDGKKHLTDDYLKSLSPLALAIWFMDDGSFTERSKGLQQRTAGGSGRVEFGVEAMSEASRVRLADYLRDVHGVDARVWIRGAAQKAVLTMTTAGSGRFLELVAPYVHPSMDHKLLARFRGRFEVHPEYVEATTALLPSRVISTRGVHHRKPVGRYDLEVFGSHNYFADGVMVHNSPETTTGGKALKFYASVRLDVRRIETLKDGTDPVGNRTRVKVVKNKVAPPFKQAEFDIIYGLGISREGGLIDMGVEHGFVRKAGAWYTYEGDQLGQGKENARSFLSDNPDLADELEKKIKEKLGIGPRVDQAADPVGDVPVKVMPIKDMPVDF
jgi:recombination protein RecA